MLHFSQRSQRMLALAFSIYNPLYLKTFQICSHFYSIMKPLVSAAFLVDYCIALQYFAHSGVRNFFVRLPILKQRLSNFPKSEHPKKYVSFSFGDRESNLLLLLVVEDKWEEVPFANIVGRSHCDGFP